MLCVNGRCRLLVIANIIEFHKFRIDKKAGMKDGACTASAFLLRHLQITAHLFRAINRFWIDVEHTIAIARQLINIRVGQFVCFARTQQNDTIVNCWDLIIGFEKAVAVIFVVQQINGFIRWHIDRQRKWTCVCGNQLREWGKLKRVEYTTVFSINILNNGHAHHTHDITYLFERLPASAATATAH